MEVHPPSSEDGLPPTPPDINEPPPLCARRPEQPFTILQHNCLGSRNVFFTLMSVRARKGCAHPTIIAIQDPPLWNSLPPSLPHYLAVHPPPSPDHRIRVVTYVYAPFAEQCSFLPLFYENGDFVAIHFTFSRPVLHTSHCALRVNNAYNTWTSTNPSVPPPIALPEIPFPSITIGDLNVHHPLTDPDRSPSSYDSVRADQFFELVTLCRYNVLNTPASYTRFPMVAGHRPAVLDYTLANDAAQALFRSWDNSLPPTGSDHTAIHTTFGALSSTPSPPHPTGPSRTGH